MIVAHLFVFFLLTSLQSNTDRVAGNSVDCTKAVCDFISSNRHHDDDSFFLFACSFSLSFISFLLLLSLSQLVQNIAQVQHRERERERERERQREKEKK